MGGMVVLFLFLDLLIQLQSMDLHSSTAARQVPVVVVTFPVELQIFHFVVPLLAQRHLELSFTRVDQANDFLMFFVWMSVLVLEVHRMPLSTFQLR
jgi:hypothetical protein